MMTSRIQELINIRNNAIVFIPNQNNNLVGIGKRVVFKEESSGQLQEYLIGSYLVLSEGESTISYKSPLASLLIGSKVNDIRRGFIGGKEKIFRIISIQNDT